MEAPVRNCRFCLSVSVCLTPVRAGLHCAPLAHRTAGTLDTGTVRLSFSHWNTREEVSRFLVAMGEILR